MNMPRYRVQMCILLALRRVEQIQNRECCMSIPIALCAYFLISKIHKCSYLFVTFRDISVSDVVCDCIIRWLRQDPLRHRAYILQSCSSRKNIHILQ
jgi:hypothetical protein